MPLIPVHGLSELRELLDATSRQHPGLLLVGSQQWPPCVELQPKIALLATLLPAIRFYAFNVDDYEEDFLHIPLMELFSARQIKYLPSQVLLPCHGEARVISTANVQEIEQELADMH